MVKTETIIKGLASPEGIPLGGKGICFSLPVSQVIGLRKMDDN